MPDPRSNMFCRLEDLGNEAAVETFLLNRLLEHLGYPDSRIRTKDSIEQLPIPRGRSTELYRPDYVLLDSRNRPVMVIDAKSPNENIDDWVYQPAGYASAINRTYPSGENPVRYGVLCNGVTLAVYPWDSNTPVFYIGFEDMVEGNTTFASLVAHVSYGMFNEVPIEGPGFQFFRPDLTTLTKEFNRCHDLIWKKEKQGPTWAFYEFVKIIFVKMREDRKIHRMIDNNQPVSAENFVFSLNWLEKLGVTTPNPFADILFAQVLDEIEEQIRKNEKKRIFASGESLRLAPSTINEVVRLLEHYDLHGIDEDLNGRMFETFLSATIRGRELGQYFTPRPIVRYMAMTSHLDVSSEERFPYILDGCCGTGGFLIEAMAILTQKIESHPAFSSFDQEKYKDLIRDARIYGIEANEDLSRVARLNMYLHGDGGSRIYHAESLDKEVNIEGGLTAEIAEGRLELKKLLVDEGTKFDVILTNPPFSMNYRASDPAQNTVLGQYVVAKTLKGKRSTSEKSSMLFVERYLDLLQEGGELVTVIDDTVLNGLSAERHRNFIRENFVIRQVISLPFNAFFKAQANIKTSILHLRKKRPGEKQGPILMAITNNIGHDDHRIDTPNRDNLGILLSFYRRWMEGEEFEPQIIQNEHPDEPLGCPLQIFIVRPESLKDRLDAFYYSPELAQLRQRLRKAAEQGRIYLKTGKDVPIVEELAASSLKELQDQSFRYFEIGNVTRYGSIVAWKEDLLGDLPTRGRLLVNANDVLFAKNNSSRGTTVIIPNEFDNSIVTTGFIAIRPASQEESLIWWSILCSEAIRKQIYYLSVTASQPEIRREIFENEFLLPYPTETDRYSIVQNARAVQEAHWAVHQRLEIVINLQETLVS